MPQCQTIMLTRNKTSAHTDRTLPVTLTIPPHTRDSNNPQPPLHGTPPPVEPRSRYPITIFATKSPICNIICTISTIDHLSPNVRLTNDRRSNRSPIAITNVHRSKRRQINVFNHSRRVIRLLPIPQTLIVKYLIAPGIRRNGLKFLPVSQLDRASDLMAELPMAVKISTNAATIVCVNDPFL
jgi:hypothetical protein